MKVGRPTREAATPSALAPALLRWAAQRGLDVAVLADRARLVEAKPSELDEVPITSTALAQLFDLTAELAGEPHLGLLLPAELTYRKFDAGALAARVAATPRDVLAAVARFAPLVFPHLDAVVRRPSDVALDFTFAGSPRGLGHHVDSYLLAFTLGHCRRGTPTIHPRSVRLLSARPSGDLAPLLHTFGTEDIEFGCESTGVTFEPAVVDQPLPSSDPMLIAAAEQIASAALRTAPRSTATFAATVGARIESMLKTGASAESVAVAMKMSARTLQRRLEDEGIRFSFLFDQVREGRAKELLATDASLQEVAVEVGFSEIATFSRAFKRWTGMPPGAFRRKKRNS